MAGAAWMVCVVVAVAVAVCGREAAGQAGGCCTATEFTTTLSGADGWRADVWYKAPFAMRIDVEGGGGGGVVRHYALVDAAGRYADYVYESATGTCVAEQRAGVARGFVALCFDASNPDWRLVAKDVAPAGSLLWSYTPQASFWHVVPSPPCTPVTVNGTWAGLVLPPAVAIGTLTNGPVAAHVFDLPAACKSG